MPATVPAIVPIIVRILTAIIGPLLMYYIKRWHDKQEKVKKRKGYSVISEGKRF
jgi:hypothetical protein